MMCAVIVPLAITKGGYLFLADLAICAALYVIDEYIYPAIKNRKRKNKRR